MSRLACAVVLAVFAVACPGPEEGPKKPTEWAGTTPHFRAVGHLNGEDLDITIEGAAATELARLQCRREYVVNLVNGEPDWANGKLDEVQIIAPVKIGDQDRYFELELKRHDFQKHSTHTTVTVVPRVDGVSPASTEQWFEWEWHNPDGSTIWEAAAQSGSFKVGEYTGTPGSNGLLIPDNEGTMGGFLDVRWSEHDQVAISFTAKCGTNKLVQKE